jgi:outer membrane protein OmpA-like peptidoglycan-associated protein
MPGRYIAIGLALLVPVAAEAAVIKQRPFDYSFEVADVRGSDVFVVCTSSFDDRLSVLPAPPPLAVRSSRDEIPVKEVLKTAPPAVDARKDCVNCLLGTVRFAFDSWEMTKNQRAKLDELIKTVPEGVVVNIDGYTCDLGSTSHNLRLSLKRANKVAAYLRGKGVPVGKVKGLGECCPVSDDRPQNRRVEISTQQKEEK